MTTSANVFMSWAREDLRRIEAIGRALAAHGLHVWRDKKLMLRMDWAAVVGETIRRSDVFIVCLSPAYLASSFAELELGFILSGQRDRGGLVIPLMLSRVEPGMLGRFPVIDAQGRSAGWVADRVASTIGTRLDAGAIVAHA